MTYQVQLLRRAQKSLAELGKSDYERMKDAIAALASEPRPVGSKKLTGRDGWRIRSGNFRAIYDIDDDNGIVTILHIGNRRDIYS